MHISIASALLGPALMVSGAAIPQGSSSNTLAPPAPVSSFPTAKHHIIKPEELLTALHSKGIEVIGNLTAPFASILDDLKQSSSTSKTESSNSNNIKTASTDDSDVKTESVDDDTVSTKATCSNPRYRTEWESYSADDRKAYLNAINCLRGKPASGKYSPADNRYEDLVRVHQLMTDVIHDNAIFLVWHRYFTWTFEDILRTECGFDRNLPWWDEGRHTGKFASSSVFSGDYYGAIAINGNCVTNGMFANSNLHIGPGGTDNTLHCLSRSGDINYTNQLTEDLVSAVNSWPEYKDMAYYAEGTFHAYGHLGVGAVQADKYASPGDPWFFLHHAYVDRNFANWQAADYNTRVNNINGNDINGNALSMDTTIDVMNLRPSVKVRDIMSLNSDKTCYRYQY